MLSYTGVTLRSSLIINKSMVIGITIWLLELCFLNPFQAKDASRQPWPGMRDASRQTFYGF